MINSTETINSVSRYGLFKLAVVPEHNQSASFNNLALIPEYHFVVEHHRVLGQGAIVATCCCIVHYN
jgi:hypothetical protein